MRQLPVELSVVIPVFNEEACLPELIRRVVAAGAGTGAVFEVVLVDDGSTDSSRALVTAASARHPGTVVGVLLAANAGQHAAVLAGMAAAAGKFVVTMDADLQNPPEEIPRLLAALRAGADVVGTVRADRQDPFFRRFASKAANRLVACFCRGRPLHDCGCMLRGYARPVVDALLRCPPGRKFIPVLALSFARQAVEIPVAHAARTGGESKYGFGRLVSLLFDLVAGACFHPRPSARPDYVVEAFVRGGKTVTPGRPCA